VHARLLILFHDVDAHVDALLRNKMQKCVDIVIVYAGELLLIRRGHQPFKDCWALPGGRVDADETPAVAAARELHEETGITSLLLRHMMTVENRACDPRGMSKTDVFYLSCSHRPDVVAGDDAVDARWFQIDALPTMAFDHRDLIIKIQKMISPKDAVFLTSNQPCKVQAIHCVSGARVVVSVTSQSSGVPEQPLGRAQIHQGATNRMPREALFPVVSFETGIVKVNDRWFDITCGLLRTRFGTFEAWSRRTPIPDSAMKQWIDNGADQSKTLGSIISPASPNDWYACGVNRSRVQIMSDLYVMLIRQDAAVAIDVIPATVSVFKGVDFLDVQAPLLTSPRDLVLGVRRLADRLLFDTVLVLDARGFLLCGEFAREGFKVVMARKSGKLPREGPTVEYTKEYGTDTIGVTTDSIQPGARVVVVDDMIATGGTMLAAERIVKLCGGTVVAFVAPYAIAAPDGRLIADGALASRMRFICTQHEAAASKCVIPDVVVNSDHRDGAYIAPPSLQMLVSGRCQIDVRWGRFARSADVSFDADAVRGKDVDVLMDPSNTEEAFVVLQLLSILYRKDPHRVRVIIPFLEQATQDRVEHRKGGMESLAMVDTIGKLVGKHTVWTFDLHAEQSQFAFYDLRHTSFVERLFSMFCDEHPSVVVVFPDDGAAKRFTHMLKGRAAVVFRKRRSGAKREVMTDDIVAPGTECVIVDDMVRSGGTMRAVEQYLRTFGASRVSALFAHAPFEPAAAQNMAGFDEVWTSDSCGRQVPPEFVHIRVVDVMDELI
jgi:adenine phosphoribosyltransferase